MAGAEDRARAARLLLDVIHKGRTTDQSFGNQTVTPLVAELVYGTLRHYYSLSYRLESHLATALRSKDLDLRCLMLVGAYQLFYSRIPDHAVLHETVNACRGLRKPWAAKLVNAVLRKLAEEGRDGSPTEESTASITETERSFEMPAWLIERLQAQYGGGASTLMQACLERAPMSLRVNVLRTTTTDYRARLKHAGLVHHGAWLDENLILESPVPGRQLRGLEEGLVSIQDSGALFACGLLAEHCSKPHSAQDLDEPNHPRILDACAAPGGKLFHLAEALPHAALTGIEQSRSRLDHLRAEAQRLGQSRVRLIEGDAATQTWWSGEPFDAILLDAPCSGTGTLRRHPDIKILRKPEDLEEYARLQGALLSNLWQLLKPGGVFVYCTCSLLDEENDAVVDAFLKATADARPAPFRLPTGTPTRHGWQLLPVPEPFPPSERGPSDPAMSLGSVDGFYYARLMRQDKAE